MGYIPITPFRRPVDAALLKRVTTCDNKAAPAVTKTVNKWEVVRELAVARMAFDLGDRDIAILQALLSFHPETELPSDATDIMVWPSNKAICERLNGMPGSTMRRHLARLVASGLLLRRDSPNGKRYARGRDGEKIAFGFDLVPLVRRQTEICDLAERQRAADEAFRRLRETVSLMRRDLSGLASYGAEVAPSDALWDQCDDLARMTARDLRRKLTTDELKSIEARLAEALDAARDRLDPPETEELSTSDAQNEQHYQSSKTDHHDLELRKEGKEQRVVKLPDRAGKASGVKPDRNLPNVPLGLVLAVCREFLTYSDDRVRHWHDLVRAADRLRPMLGISSSAWEEARTAMGPEEASVVLVAMLERMDEIRSPGGYLRALTDRAADGSFSCGPMIMALMRKSAA